MLITQKREDLAAHIASHLHLNPHEPNEWPVQIIERIMKEMEDAAREVLERRSRDFMRSTA